MDKDKLLKLSKEELVKEIKKLFLDPNFDLNEASELKIILPKMNEEDLRILLNSLNIKLKTVFDTDVLLYGLGKKIENNLNLDKLIDNDAAQHPWQDLTRENLVYIIGHQLNLWLNKGLDLKKEIELYFEGDPLEPEKLRKELLLVLGKNEEIITIAEPLITSNLKLKSNVAFWLRDYKENIKGKSNKNLARAEYFSNSPNIKKLGSQEKEKIKKIIELYDFLETPILLFSITEPSFLTKSVLPQNLATSLPSKSKNFASSPIKNNLDASVNNQIFKKIKFKSFEEKYFEEPDSKN